MLHPVAIRQVVIDGDSYWGRRRAINRTITIPAQLQQLRDTGRLDALDPHWQGQRHRFWDSDLGKWLEAAYSELASGDDPALRAGADQVLERLAAAQQPDGYLQSFHTTATPVPRYRNLRDDHEMYSMGHVIEGCCAQIESELGDVGRRLAGRILDHLWLSFGPDGQMGYCGHPEIELALLRLWRCTGDDRARTLAQLMVDRRGCEPHLFTAEAAQRGEDPTRHWSWRFTGSWAYFVAHRPVRALTDADGHAVRCMYLCQAMTELVAAGERSLAPAIERIWASATGRRMYITGGIGSTREGERFTCDHDLPDHTAYCETCAAIGLARWARARLSIRLDGQVGDVMELALHNAMLAGISLDGQRYFYGNPLAIHPHDRRGAEEVAAQRQPWFGVACCPPNVARTLAQLGTFAYAEAAGRAAIHLYLPGTVRIAGLTLRIDTRMPWDGAVRITVQEAPSTPVELALRLPAWCPAPRIEGAEVRDGYAHLTRVWMPGMTVTLDLPMPVRRRYAHPAVRSAVGRVALMRGPLVYALEDIDHGSELDHALLPDSAEVRIEDDGCVLRAPGWLRGEDAADDLYRDRPVALRPATLRFIPYAHWGNRGGHEMRVWVRSG